MRQRTTKGTLDTVRAILLLLGLWLAASSAWAGVRAVLDRDQVYQGDTLSLTVEADGASGELQPDLSPLDRDFQVEGVSTSNQIRIINGRRSDKTQWIVQLKPKRLGTLRIPALSVGGEQTRPLQLQVREIPPEVAKAMAEQVFIDVDVEPADASPFVQQQVHYNVRLFYAVPLVDGSLSEPAPENAVVERLGKDKQYQTRRNGRDYGVIERRYAIFPEKSGELRIPPVVFEGRVASRDKARNSRTGMGSMMDRFFNDSFFQDPFFGSGMTDDFFSGSPFGDRGKPIRTRGKAMNLDVQPLPAAYTGRHWLPADHLVVHDSWAENPPQWKVGEPVTRVLTIEAKGLTASQIPELTMPESPQIRIYPEKPVTESRTDGNWVYGRSEQTLAYVAREAGKLAVPGATLNWWDTSENRERTLTLPPWEIQVAPGELPVLSDPKTPEAAPTGESEPVLSETADRSLVENLVVQFTSVQHLWPWAVGAAALLILLLGGSSLRRRTKLEAAPAGGPGNPGGGAVTAGTRPDVRAARKAVQTACEANDPRRAATKLLHWAAVQWPENPPRSLGAVADRVAHGADQVRDLDRTLYSPNTADWKGEPLWETLKGGLATEKAGKSVDREILEPIYPRHA